LGAFSNGKPASTFPENAPALDSAGLRAGRSFQASRAGPIKKGMTMTIMMKLALAAALAAALASSALAIAGKLRPQPEDAITTAQYCMPHEDDSAAAQKVYCRHAG
jgi:hypothetical protein